MTQSSFQTDPERLIAHIQVLAQQIGPRPPGSAKEHRALEYVCDRLQTLGITDVREQMFKSPPSNQPAVLPYVGLGLVSLLLMRAQNGLRWLGGIGLIGALLGLRNALLKKPSPFYPLIATAESHNLIARIEPHGDLTGFVIFTAHLDTTEHNTGADDNASGVAVLLELAADLQANPLEHTEVVLLFTGGSTAGASGIHAYIDQYAPPKDFTTFINVIHVGGRESSLSYLSSAGIPAFAEVHPAPRITALVNRLANRHPEYGVYPRTATNIDEMGALRARGFEAITLAGIPRGGNTPTSIDHLSPEVMQRALRFVKLILADLDVE
ncbi:MAG: M28 family peptidase [Anaerolineae bacterium]